MRELIIIDKKAKRIVEGAENNLANLDSIIQSKSEEILNEVDINIRAKISQMRTDSEEYINLKKAEIDRIASTQLAKMEAVRTDNLDKWRSDIFKVCTFRELKP